MFKSFTIGRSEEYDEPDVPDDPKDYLSYDFKEARDYLSERFAAVNDWHQTLPPAARPGGFASLEAVALPHLFDRVPSSKAFFKSLNLTYLDSRWREVRPRGKFTVNVEDLDDPDYATQRAPALYAQGLFWTFGVFCVGRFEDFLAAPQKIMALKPDSEAARGATYLESVEPLDPDSCLKLDKDKPCAAYEVYLSRVPAGGGDFPLDAFIDYAKDVGFEASRKVSVSLNDSVFIPVTGPRENLSELAKFIFVRQITEAATMRPLKQVVRSPSGELVTVS
ncbi:MAG: hypothetical protein LBO66_01000 [Deltaproteobacteria bacterium]|jgi:hypothetical protein|nr:hypothetical protein [Deltaproteobacteria bacterium]